LSYGNIKQLLYKLLFIKIVIMKSLIKYWLNSAFKKHVFIKSKTNGTVIINNSRKCIIMTIAFEFFNVLKKKFNNSLMNLVGIHPQPSDRSIQDMIDCLRSAGYSVEK
jgi:hypothetical protein